MNSDGTTATRRDSPGWSGPASWPRSAVALIVCCGLGTLLAATVLSSDDLYVFNTCLLAAIGAIALNLVMGTAGQVSIGNAAFLGVGSFSAVWFLGQGVPFPLDIIFATITVGVVGLLVGMPALRLQGLYLALATLAAHYIVYFVCNLYQEHSVGAGGGFLVDPLFQSAGIRGQQQDWAWVLVVVLAVVILVIAPLLAGKSGRAWRLIRDHEAVAPAMGINVTSYKLIAFVISSMLIGFQGALAAHLSGVVSVNDITLAVAISYLAMVLIGGLDSIVGAVLGAFLITALPTFVNRTVPHIVGSGAAATNVPQISQVIYGLLIIVFVTRSPGGLTGWARSIRARARGARRHSSARQIGRPRSPAATATGTPQQLQKPSFPPAVRSSGIPDQETRGDRVT
jgi:branched-chain amino acid transport system permease protein